MATRIGGDADEDWGLPRNGVRNPGKVQGVKEAAGSGSCGGDGCQVHTEPVHQFQRPVRVHGERRVVVQLVRVDPGAVLAGKHDLKYFY